MVRRGSSGPQFVISLTTSSQTGICEGKQMTIDLSNLVVCGGCKKQGESQKKFLFFSLISSTNDLFPLELSEEELYSLASRLTGHNKQRAKLPLY